MFTGNGRRESEAFCVCTPQRTNSSVSCLQLFCPPLGAPGVFQGRGGMALPRREHKDKDAPPHRDPTRPGARGSPQFLEPAGGVLQPLAQRPHARVPQVIEAQVQFPKVGVDPEHRADTLTGGRAEPANAQPGRQDAQSPAHSARRRPRGGLSCRAPPDRREKQGAGGWAGRRERETRKREGSGKEGTQEYLVWAGHRTGARV